MSCRKIAVHLTVVDVFSLLGGLSLSFAGAIIDNRVHPNDFGCIVTALERAAVISKPENFASIHHHNAKYSSFSLFFLFYFSL